MARSLLVAIVCLVLVLGSPRAAGIPLFDFEDSGQGWHIEGAEETPLKAQTAPDGRSAIIVPLVFPGSVRLVCREEIDLSRIGRLVFTIALPLHIPKTLQIQCILIDSEGWWYQSDLDLPEIGAAPEGWVNLEADLSEGANWAPKGHATQWQRVILSHPISSLRFALHCPQSFSGNLSLDRVEALSLQSTEEAFPFVSVEPFSSKVRQYDFNEMSFQLSTDPVQIFLPSNAPARCRVQAPSGKIQQVEAFPSRDYFRALRSGREKLIPVGGLRWKIRIGPVEQGRYQYDVFRPGANQSIKKGSFESVPSDLPGCVELSRDDPRLFALSTGQPYYPIGLNLRAFPERGTFDADAVISRLSSAGGNWCRTWMCSWWTAIEWSHSFENHYHGLGAYSLQNAWKLDWFLSRCREEGIQVQLVLNNHGQFSIWTDPEWPLNPYNRELGGPLEAPEDFFVHPGAGELFENRMRYIISRYAAYSNLLSWELWNEVDLTNRYNSDWCGLWHREMGRFIRSTDPYGHLITTHFMKPQMDPLVWSLPELEYTQSDAYDDPNIVRRLQQVCQFKAPYSKPHLANEFWREGEYDTHNHVHCGLWASFFLPLSGAAMPWEWKIFQQKDLFPEIQHLAAYSSDVDRGRESFAFADLSTPDPRVRGLAAMGRETVCAWLYETRLPEEADEAIFETIELGEVAIPGVSDRAVVIEWMSPWDGGIIDESKGMAQGGTLTVRVPAFQRDIALKARKSR